MIGYGRIKQTTGRRSKSMDFGDLSYRRRTTESKPKPQEIYHSHSTIPERDIRTPDPVPEPEYEDGAGEIFGVILSRKRPASFAASSKPVFERPTKTSLLQNIVKRSLSMRRSSSALEGYRRIHHQCDFTADDHPEIPTKVQSRPTAKKGNIFKACKRVFGL